MEKLWTMNEINFMLDNQYNLSVNEIADHLGRSYRSVKSQAERFNVKLMSQSYKNFYVREYYFYNRYEEVIAFGTIEEIAKTLGKKFETIKNYIYRSYQNKENLRSCLVPVEEEVECLF